MTSMENGSTAASYCGFPEAVDAIEEYEAERQITLAAMKARHDAFAEERRVRNTIFMDLVPSSTPDASVDFSLDRA